MDLSVSSARTRTQRVCVGCKREGYGMKRCLFCKNLGCQQYFCNKKCQLSNWKTHKAVHSMLNLLNCFQTNSENIDRIHTCATQFSDMINPHVGADVSAARLAVSNAGCVDTALILINNSDARRICVSHLLSSLCNLLFTKDDVRIEIVNRMFVNNAVGGVQLLNKLFDMFIEDTYFYNDNDDKLIDCIDTRRFCVLLLSFIFQTPVMFAPIQTPIRFIEAFNINWELPEQKVMLDADRWMYFRNRLVMFISYSVVHMTPQRPYLLRLFPVPVNTLNKYIQKTVCTKDDDELCRNATISIANICKSTDAIFLMELLTQHNVLNTLLRMPANTPSDQMVNLVNQVTITCSRHIQNLNNQIEIQRIVTYLMPWFEFNITFIGRDDLGDSKTGLLCILCNMFEHHKFIQLNQARLKLAIGYGTDGLLRQNWSLHDETYRVHLLIYLRKLVSIKTYNLTEVDVDALTKIVANKATTPEVLFKIIDLTSVQFYTMQGDSRTMNFYLAYLFKKKFIQYMFAVADRDDLENNLNATIKCLCDVLLMVDKDLPHESEQIKLILKDKLTPKAKARLDDHFHDINKTYIFELE